jgi:hypothetical protein
VQVPYIRYRTSSYIVEFDLLSRSLEIIDLLLGFRISPEIIKIRTLLWYADVLLQGK